MYRSLQACRAIAALLVVAFHAAGTLAKAKYFGAAASGLGVFWFGGAAGVAFFFVLSGFIILRAHREDLGRPSRLPGYLGRRLVRIYPSYLLVFAGVFATAWLQPALRESLPADAGVLLRSILLWPQDPAVVGEPGAPVLSVAWTLQYEMLFYALFGLAILSRTLGAAAACAWIAWVLAARFVAPLPFPLDFLGRPLVLLFGVGVACGAWLRRRPGTAARPALIGLGAAGFVAACACARYGQSAAVTQMLDLAWGVSGAVLLIGLVRTEDAGRLPPVPRVLVTLGDASYAIYLIHYPVVALGCKLAAGLLPHAAWGAWLAFPLLVLAGTAAGVVFHRRVERPMLRRFGATSRAEPQNSASSSSMSSGSCRASAIHSTISGKAKMVSQ